MCTPAVFTVYIYPGREEPSEAAQFQGLPKVFELFTSLASLQERVCHLHLEWPVFHILSNILILILSRQEGFDLKETTLCPLYTTQRCKAIYWLLVDLPKDILLKKIDFLSPRSHQMPVAPWKGMGDHAALPFPHQLEC